MRLEQRMPSAIFIAELCSLLGYSRQAYYKHLRMREKEALRQDLLIQQVLIIRKTQKRIGARKLFFMLQQFMKEHNNMMGRDSFFDMLRDNNLLMRRRRSWKPKTTFSDHWYKKYDNLIEEFIPNKPNQLWVSDITYIHLENEFAYLSLITDAYSHKVVGFYLGRDLSADCSIQALEMAIKTMSARDRASTRLVHHSDRGIQYCSFHYVSLLQNNFIDISMTQTGDPRENALAERLNGILKNELLEEVYLNYDHAQMEVAKAISIYNHQRPHSSIELLTPAQAHFKSGTLKRLWKSYYGSKKNVNPIQD